MKKEKTEALMIQYKGICKKLHDKTIQFYYQIYSQMLPEAKNIHTDSANLFIRMKKIYIILTQKKK